MSPEDKPRTHRFLRDHLDDGNPGVEESNGTLVPVSGRQIARQALSEPGKKRTWPLPVRLIGYVLFLGGAFTASVALGGVIAVTAEHLGLL
jgi:hypothetical protein